MSKQRKPELPRAVTERMAKRTFIRVVHVSDEHAHDRFIRSVRAGVTPDMDDMRIVADQLELVLSKRMTFPRAFGLNVGQGRKSDDKVAWRNDRMNAEVEELREEGWTLENAVELVALRYEVGEDSVLNAHKQKTGVTRNAKWARKRGYLNKR